MARKKKDQLSVVGLLSAILRNSAQQRSLAKGRDKKALKIEKKAEKARQKHRKALEPKDERTPEDIRAEIDSTRGELVGTVAAIKTDLSLPTRARLLRAHLSKRVPRDLKGEPEATVIAGSVLAGGLGIVGLSAYVGGKVSSRARRREARTELETKPRRR
jgi:hypothetical protein